MPIDPITSLGSLGRLRPLADAPPAAAATPATGFAAVLNGLLGENTRANAAADAAVAGLADGSAQDLHTVALAVAQADLSFRLILELRNRLAEAFQEVTRMQV
jgi:flagellar hook-basal body complex protein FliE